LEAAGVVLNIGSSLKLNHLACLNQCNTLYILPPSPLVEERELPVADGQLPERQVVLVLDVQRRIADLERKRVVK
jgi:hypothetical protein